MMDDLPNRFDVIVVGTGMPECIIAAAVARVGKKVLHLDRHGYYGGDWASFNYDKFMEWVNELQAPDTPVETPLNLIATLASFVGEGDNLALCPVRSKTITNVTFKSYIKDVPDPPIANNEESSGEASTSENSDLTEASATISQNIGEASNEAEEESSSGDYREAASASSSSSSNPTLTLQPQEWTLSGFMENRRKFNIDLAPKIMFSRGSMVELLISSNIARYAEFQCITRVLTHINGHIEQVPCSRADVFSTKNVTVVEKRMLMKFLTFCSKFEEQTDEFKGYEDKPFIEFLRSKKLTSNVEHYVVHAIAMVDEKCTTIEGLKSTQKFLQSLGRYGKSPFLCTCYGSAELPQCFCRLCAVYEGMYYLKRKVDGVILDNDNKCHGVVTMGQRIGCEWLVMESSYSPPDFYNPTLQRLSRAILITDASLCPSEKRENTLLRLPPSEDIKNPITILELSSKNYVCPEDLYLVYLCCRSSGPKAEDDLKPAIDLLFATNDTTSASDEKKSNQKPNLLWSVYYNQRDTSTIELSAHTPDGVFLTSSPDVNLDYEHAVKEARDIFELICPGEEFLPRAPDPEDILIECHNNPGDDGDGGKIENDVNGPEDSVGDDAAHFEANDESTNEKRSPSPDLTNENATNE